MKITTIFIIIALFLNACSKETKDENFETLSHFYNNSSLLKIDVAYEVDNEPYTNSGFNNGDNFTFTENNLNQLFSHRNKPISVTIDKSLNEMELIPAQNKANYTNQEIRDLSKQYKPTNSTANQNTMYVLFLDGYYNFNGTVLNQTIGVHVGKNTVAMFKPAIDNILSSYERKHIEQRILVHEIGHAIGLVDAGVPMQNNHLDTGNGKHCSNTSCVMYKSHSGIMSGSVNEFVFGQDCVNDIAQY